MSKKVGLAILSTIALATSLLYAAIVNGYLDFTIMPAPSNPPGSSSQYPNGLGRVYVDSSTSLLTCLLSTGASCMPTIPSVGGVILKTGSYATVAGDTGNLISFNCASACTLTLPASPPSLTWWIATESTGAGALTVSPNGLNLDGSASSLSVPTNQGVFIYSNGTNYYSERGLSASAITLQTNSVNNSSQALLNLINGGSVVLTNTSGGTVTVTGPTFQVNGTNTSSQATINYENGTGCTITNPSAGNVSIACTGSSTSKRQCIIDNDTQSATPLTVAQFSGGCQVPAAATINEVDVWGGTGILGGSGSTTGTSSINLGYYTPNGGSVGTILSGVLATSAGYACALASTSGTCSNGLTSSSSVYLAVTSLSAGQWIRTNQASADGVQTWYRIAVTYTY